MLRRSISICTLSLLAAFLTSAASAQVVRFETTIGDFDMVLNPTNDFRLQGHVDNMLQYVEDNRYTASWINRAPDGFVLQMGGFYSHTRRPPPTIASTRSVVTFDPVEGEPAATTGLSNTVGTVALALPSDSNMNVLRNAGTSSFFVNLTSNAFLDPDFTVFAAIPDMTVIDQIAGLMKIDRTTDPDFGAASNNSGFKDVPIDENGFQVFITRAFQVNDTLSVARARAGVESLMAGSAAGGGSGSPLTANVVPEPANIVLLMLSVLCLLGGRRAGRR